MAKFDSLKSRINGISKLHELNETQIAIVHSSPTLILQVKFSDLKYRDGKNVFSFSTRVSNLPKLAGDPRHADSDRSFEFTPGYENKGHENPWNSVWMA